jgi:inositol 3-alpha-galactosyltransferase
MIYLDGDIQVFENIDHLFDHCLDGYFYAVMDCFCEKTWSHSPQYNIGYCQQCPQKVQWPAEMGSPPPLYFNAGMFVYEPNLLTYHDLLETLQVTPPTSFAEQVINRNVRLTTFFFGNCLHPARLLHVRSP